MIHKGILEIWKRSKSSMIRGCFKLKRKLKTLRWRRKRNPVLRLMMLWSRIYFPEILLRIRRKPISKPTPQELRSSNHASQTQIMVLNFRLIWLWTTSKNKGKSKMTKNRKTHNNKQAKTNFRPKLWTLKNQITIIKVKRAKELNSTRSRRAMPTHLMTGIWSTSLLQTIRMVILSSLLQMNLLVLKAQISCYRGLLMIRCSRSNPSKPNNDSILFLKTMATTKMTTMKKCSIPKSRLSMRLSWVITALKIAAR